MEFLKNPPGAGERSACDLLHFRYGFEIKMNVDRNGSCFIFVNALMHDDFFDSAVEGGCVQLCDIGVFLNGFHPLFCVIEIGRASCRERV